MNSGGLTEPVVQTNACHVLCPVKRSPAAEAGKVCLVTKLQRCRWTPSLGYLVPTPGDPVLGARKAAVEAEDRVSPRGVYTHEGEGQNITQIHVESWT